MKNEYECKYKVGRKFYIADENVNEEVLLNIRNFQMINNMRDYFADDSVKLLEDIFK